MFSIKYYMKNVFILYFFVFSFKYFHVSFSFRFSELFFNENQTLLQLTLTPNVYYTLYSDQHVLLNE